MKKLPAITFVLLSLFSLATGLELVYDTLPAYGKKHANPNTEDPSVANYKKGLDFLKKKDLDSAIDAFYNQLTLQETIMHQIHITHFNWPTA